MSNKLCHEKFFKLFSIFLLTNQNQSANMFSTVEIPNKNQGVTNMKITRKETTCEPVFTEKDLTDQYAERLAFRAVRDYRKRLPEYDECKFYGIRYIVTKKDGKECCVATHSFSSINEAIDWYNREYTPSMSECYYIKIICVRNDAGCMIKNESLFIATVIESEAIER